MFRHYELDGIDYVLWSDNKTACVCEANKGVSTVKIPKFLSVDDEKYTVIEIFSNAFYDCISLKSIVLPNSIKVIGNYVFCNCANLTNVTLSNSIKSIKDGMFKGCSSLTEIVLPHSIKSIGYGAFFDCVNLEKVTSQSSVKNIAYSAFYSCPKLDRQFIEELGKN